MVQGVGASVALYSSFSSTTAAKRFVTKGTKRTLVAGLIQGSGDASGSGEGSCSDGSSSGSSEGGSNSGAVAAAVAVENNNNENDAYNMTLLGNLMNQNHNQNLFLHQSMYGAQNTNATAQLFQLQNRFIRDVGIRSIDAAKQANNIAHCQPQSQATVVPMMSNVMSTACVPQMVQQQTANQVLAMPCSVGSTRSVQTCSQLPAAAPATTTTTAWRQQAPQMQMAYGTPMGYGGASSTQLVQMVPSTFCNTQAAAAADKCVEVNAMFEKQKEAIIRQADTQEQIIKETGNVMANRNALAYREAQQQSPGQMLNMLSLLNNNGNGNQNGNNDYMNLLVLSSVAGGGGGLFGAGQGGSGASNLLPFMLLNKNNGNQTGNNNNNGMNALTTAALMSSLMAPRTEFSPMASPMMMGRGF